MTQNLITAVADDIYQIQIPLPFALRIVNCYLLPGEAGWTIVDTGLNTSSARSAWQQAFTALDIRPRDIEQIVLTHTHPDHYGLAGWLVETCMDDGGQLPPVRMSALEAVQADKFWKVGEVLQRPFFTFWQQCGLADDMIQDIIDSTSHTRQRTFPHPAEHEIISLEEKIQLGERLLQPILTPGHSDGHLMFYDETDQLLLSGDHVLLKITPNISLWPGSHGNPLGAYLQSLSALQSLAVSLALPGHYPVIEDFHGRIQQISQHHKERLNLILEALTAPKTVFEVSQTLFDHDKLSVHEMRFATAETLAHLEYLRSDGRVQQHDEPIWQFSQL